MSFAFSLPSPSVQRSLVHRERVFWLFLSVFWRNASRDHPTSHTIGHYVSRHGMWTCVTVLLSPHHMESHSLNLKERRSSSKRSVINCWMFLSFCWGQQYGKRWYATLSPSPRLSWISIWKKGTIQVSHVLYFHTDWWKVRHCLHLVSTASS